MARKNTSTALVKDSKKEADSLESFLMERIEVVQKVCVGVMNPTRLVHMAMANARRSPKLLQCTSYSWMVAILDAAFFGLEPNPQLGEAYLIPFKNGKRDNVLEVQFMPGYKGMRRLAIESGNVVSIRAHAVYEKDEFELRPDREWEGKAPFVHKVYRDPADHGKEARALTDVYAVWTLPGGEHEFLHMPRFGPQSIEYYRSRSRARNDGPWASEGTYPAMAKKTVIRRACDELPIRPNSKVGMLMTHEESFESSPEPMHMFSYSDDSGAKPELAQQAEKPPVTAPPAPAEGDPGPGDLFS